MQNRFKWIAASLIFASSQMDGYQAPPLDRPKFIPTEIPKDREITQELQEKLLDDHYLAPYYSQISIQTVNGVVILTGAIDSHRISLSIEAKARQIQGVKRVDNQIQVDPTPPYVPPL